MALFGKTLPSDRLEPKTTPVDAYLAMLARYRHLCMLLYISSLQF